MATALGVPLKILHDAAGAVVSVELSTGDTYKGKLVNVEDNMNIELQDVVHTNKKGEERQLPTIYLRGSNVVFFSLPEMLRLAPVAVAASTEKKPAAAAGRGRGAGFGGRGGSGAGRKRPRED